MIPKELKSKGAELKFCTTETWFHMGIKEVHTSNFIYPQGSSIVYSWWERGYIHTVSLLQVGQNFVCWKNSYNFQKSFLLDINNMWEWIGKNGLIFWLVMNYSVFLSYCSWCYTSRAAAWIWIFWQRYDSCGIYNDWASIFGSKCCR